MTDTTTQPKTSETPLSGEQSKARGVVSEALSHKQWLVHVVWINDEGPSDGRLQHRVIEKGMESEGLKMLAGFARMLDGPKEEIPREPTPVTQHVPQPPEQPQTPKLPATEPRQSPQAPSEPKPHSVIPPGVMG